MPMCPSPQPMCPPPPPMCPPQQAMCPPQQAMCPPCPPSPPQQYCPPQPVVMSYKETVNFRDCYSGSATDVKGQSSCPPYSGEVECGYGYW